LEQFVLYADYLYQFVPVSDNILYNEKMKVSKELVKEQLPKLVELLENIENWNEETIKQTLITYNKENNLKNGQTLWPIRSILS
jgi:glutamyl/glutaminyl-tRNA synthetase